MALEYDHVNSLKRFPEVLVKKGQHMAGRVGREVRIGHPQCHPMSARQLQGHPQEADPIPLDDRTEGSRTDQRDVTHRREPAPRVVGMQNGNRSRFPAQRDDLLFLRHAWLRRASRSDVRQLPGTATTERLT